MFMAMFMGRVSSGDQRSSYSEIEELAVRNQANILLATEVSM